jgi:hypothetical protein
VPPAEQRGQRIAKGAGAQLAAALHQAFELVPAEVTDPPGAKVFVVVVVHGQLHHQGPRPFV